MHGTPMALLLILWCLVACETAEELERPLAAEVVVPAVKTGFLKKNVPADAVEQFVPPADSSHGLPDSLTGTWWTDAKTVQYVVSFKNAAWDASRRTVSVRFTAPGMYAQPPREVQERPAGDFDARLVGFDAVFDEGFKHIELLPVGGGEGGKMSMDLAADGDWIRHTQGKPDYHLRRIVKADGRRDRSYGTYLARFGATATIDEVRTKVGFENAATVELPADGTPVYLTTESSSREDIAVATVLADVPFALASYAADASLAMNSINGRNVLTKHAHNIIGIRANGAQGGKVEVRLAPSPTLEATPGETAEIAYEHGEPTYIQLKVAADAGRCRLTVASKDPFAVLDGAGLRPIQEAVDGKLEIIDICQSMARLIAAPKVTAAGSMTVALEVATVEAPAQVLTVDGPAVTGTIEGPSIVQAFRVEPRAGRGTFKFQFTAATPETSGNRQVECCVITTIGMPTAQAPFFFANRKGVFAMDNAILASVYQQAVGAEVWVYFIGAAGASASSRTYTLKAVSN